MSRTPISRDGEYWNEYRRRAYQRFAASEAPAADSTAGRASPLGVALVMLLALALVLAMNDVARADLLWDNYRTAPDGYDGIAGVSSERRTEVSESWAADDFILAAPVLVQELRWIGFRDPSRTYLADVLIVDAELSAVLTLSDQAYGASVLGSAFDLQVYAGTVAIPDLNLPAGRYYAAVRLADSDLGRNFVATTGNGVLHGETFAIFRSSFFGFPDWVDASNAVDTGPTELAYQVHGVVIPEPGAGSLLLMLAMVVKRR
ncbi:MAG: hypothetical protein AB7Q17_14270 [Phycisphaerae bacterium]